MGRYTGPSCRQCRRAGTKLFLKGARCYMSKCPVDQGHPAPGMHGMRRSRKISEYGRQLREKQKLRQQFGMQEGQFRRFYERALRARGVTGENLLQMLELRLDNVVYRMGFAVSRRAARQFVLHKHVTLNGRTANVPSIVLKPGDVVGEIGCADYLGRIYTYEEACAQQAIPLGITPGGKVTRPIAKGERFTTANFAPDTGKFVYRLRQMQDAVLAIT